MKKNLYFFQVNYSYGKSAHIPYTAGQLSAYALSDKDVGENFCLEEIFFLRENVNDVLARIKEPAVAAFSTYIWNYNYNKTLAKMIKEKYPDCVIVFGGHHVSPGGQLLEECPFIDYLLHGEGEVIFRQLLRAVLGLEKPQDIPGISMRTDDGILTNPEMISSECDFPSPYLLGYFDRIIKEHPEKDFMALIETSRGCPNSCAYCDWSNMKSKIRKFPLERIYGEIEWMAENRIKGLGSADSNFGMFSRDVDITKKIVEARLNAGYPQGFQTSYAKNSNDTVFEIGMLLEKSRMNKGITLSFQSMNEEVLKNIGRQNISIESYSRLMDMYNEAGVATYTELILGLPGETYESLVDGIDKLLRLGQHNSIYIHNCEWLPCAIMGRPEYVDKYKIKTSHIPLNQPHREDNEEDNIPEFSNIVTSTYSMDENEWKKMNLFSFTVQAFHHMGLLQFVALYLYNEGICSYKDFYTGVLSFFLENKNTVGGKAFSEIEKHLDNVLAGKGTLSCTDERFGRVQWPFEEYLFLSCVYDADTFYDELESFLGDLTGRDEIFSELYMFQKKMLKRPFDSEIEFSCRYNFPLYFNALLDGNQEPLKAEENVVRIDVRPFENWENYSRVIAWFGRKDSNCTYIRKTLQGHRHEKDNRRTL